MKFKFQSFFDISTSASSMQVIQWSVGGKSVIDRCTHLFGAYKYFKLGKISVKMVPASTLPVDPLGLSYADTDPQTVDPRDQMNPGLVRITNGEDIFTDVSSLSTDKQEQVYNTMMLDPRWSKFMLQSGFRRSAYPLYWQVGQFAQDKFPGSIHNVPAWSDDNVGATQNLADVAQVIERVDADNGSNAFRFKVGDSSPRGLFQVGHRGRLGYLPTDFYQNMIAPSVTDPLSVYGINNVPEVSVITCVLPKAYKTIYYYRVFVTEEVYFAGLRSAPMSYPDQLGNGAYLRAGIDNFLLGMPVAIVPGGSSVASPTIAGISRGGRITQNINNDGSEQI